MNKKVIFAFVVLIVVTLVSCEKRDDVHPESYNLILRKSMIASIDSFEIRSTGVDIFWNQQDLPMGESAIKLGINSSDLHLVFFLVFND
jgi:uncharacterized lipoprotein NlpE involved in copper resistance